MTSPVMMSASNGSATVSLWMTLISTSGNPAQTGVAESLGWYDPELSKCL